MRLVEFLCALVALLNTVAMAALPILGAVALVKWVFWCGEYGTHCLWVD